MAPVNGVLLTKCVPISTNLTLSALPKLRPAPLSATAVLLKGGASPSSSGYASSSNSTVDEESMAMGSPVAAPTKAKKRRLDHLSWEEKVQRKKLKNRVAAQTSRDRKKARMEEMEYEIKELTEKTEILQNKCESLQSINESLLAKNQKLDTEMEVLRQELAEMKQLAKNTSNINNNNNISSSSKSNNIRNSSNSNSNSTGANASAEGCVSTLTGSAASNADPLQQGTQVDTQSSAHALTSKALQQQLKQTASLWRIVALCLLYKTCCSSTMKSSTRDDLKSWPKVCSQISQQTWKQAMAHAAKLLPKMQASQSDSLDQWWGPQQNGWNPTGIELMA